MPTTAMPSSIADSCMQYCKFYHNHWESLSAGKLIGNFHLPRYFRVSFQVTGAAGYSSSSSERLNVINFRNTANERFLSLSMTELSVQPELIYKHQVIAPYMQVFNPTLSASVRNITISVEYDAIRVWSTDAGSIVHTIGSVQGYLNADTTGDTYGIYVSGPGLITAGGSISNIVITGKNLR